MSFVLASDLHLEFLPPWLQQNIPEHMLPDPSSAHLLVLAGDVGNIVQPNFRSKLATLAEPYTMVLYVPGNHEYYDETLSTPMNLLEREMEAACMSTPNVVFMQKRSVVIRDTIFMGCTLWTDPAPSFWFDPPVRDYSMICGFRPGVAVTPKETAGIHKEHAAWLRSEIKRAKKLIGVRQAVVVTHHCPDIALSKECRNRKVSTRPWYYATDMADLVSDPFIHTWCHGHTHESYVYRSPSTGVSFATNALGYQNEDTGFQRNAVVKFI